MALGQQHRFTPHSQSAARTIPAVTEMSPSVAQWLLGRARIVIGLALALAPAAGLAFLSSAEGGEDPRSAYALATPNNVITRLQSRIDTGQTALAYDSKRGYLPAVLKALHIPVSSQMLVFSKTSVQKELISPHTPRALYFDANAYIGYLPNARSLEVAVLDPRLGPVYYVLLQKPQERPLFFRTVEACLECHATRISHYIPEHLMRSVFANTEGELVPNAKSFVTTDASPMVERWGGWYVTGRRGSQRHMGNSFIEKPGDTVTKNPEQGATVTDLHRLVDTSPYLTPHSDIVALMVLGHQTHLQNLITQAFYQTKAALEQEKASHYVHDTPHRIKEACEPLIRAMLFQNETPLKSPIFGASGFAEQFSAHGPHDRKNRSLWQLDLKRRLFHYPCSYTIYSEAFDALPDPAKDYLYRRLWEVLSGRDRGKEFAHLSASDRRAIWEILLETKPAFAAWAARR